MVISKKNHVSKNLFHNLIVIDGISLKYMETNRVQSKI